MHSLFFVIFSIPNKPLAVEANTFIIVSLCQITQLKRFITHFKAKVPRLATLLSFVDSPDATYGTVRKKIEKSLLVIFATLTLLEQMVSMEINTNHLSSLLKKSIRFGMTQLVKKKINLLSLPAASHFFN